MLGFRQPTPTRSRYLRALLMVVIGVTFLGGGYLVGSDFLETDPFELPLSQMLITILFWPTFAFQVLLQVGATIMTINTVGEEQRRQTWDSVRTTSSGAALTLRTRWSAAIFYKMRGFIGILIIIRLNLIGAMLYDLTAFRGEYLNYLIGSILPEIPLAVGVLLLALTMTASLLLPIVGLGLDAAIGLLISTAVQQRTYVVLSQMVLTAVRLVIIGALLIGATQFRTDALSAGDLATWLILFGFAAIGDWGLSFLYLGYYGATVWADVPYGVFIGLAMLLFALFQAALTDGILSFAVYRAERQG
jgi:hypothetical protein